MRNSLSNLSGIKQGFRNNQFTNTEFGFSFSDFAKKITAPLQKTLQTNVYDVVKNQATSVLGKDITSSLSSKIGEAVEKQGDSLEAQGKALITAKISDVVNSKKVQDGAIKSTFNAAADALSNTTIGLKDAYKTGGINGVRTAYPGVFYGAVGVTGLITLRFVVGSFRRKA